MSVPLHILARTDDIVVIAKPPHLLVHRTPLASRDKYFVMQSLRDQLGQHVFPVVRLDRAASGCMPVALSSEAAARLQIAMQSATKTYVAFTRGLWKREGEVVIDKPMKDDKGVLKEASSVADCLGTSLEPRCSLLRVRPRTGRFHQVRRHVRDLSHPIVQDRQHGDNKTNRWWRETHDYTRLGLHCLRLELPMGEGLVVESPLFTDHYDLFTQLPWWDDAVTKEPGLARPPLTIPEMLLPKPDPEPDPIG
jgi:tRNA pseudouridine65 synthase